jgi:5-methylcytosine-specific restriction enzyme A
MPNITFERLVRGEVYHRPELASLWGYQSWNAISRGVITPAGQNVVMLFVTKEKQQTLTQYQDHFEGDQLHWEGETNHGNDSRLVDAESVGDEIQLFYRHRHHSPFTYYGQIHLFSHDLRATEPSRFVFTTARTEAAAVSAIATEERTHGTDDATFVPDGEGRRIIRQQVMYERSPRNRARALEIHGMKCMVCGFDFNEFYGSDLARDYIEVHHTKSITEVGGDVVNPETDLVPLCSNCHSMAHRERGRIISVDELKATVKTKSEARA